MELKVWGKTMVSVQKYLERLTNAIDSLIEKRAYASAFVSTKNLTEQGAYSVANDLIELSERKINLINLNIICFNALKEIDKISAKILILKFIDCLPSSEIATLLEISDRTFFRRLNSAYDNLEKWLLRNNFDKEYFEEKFKNEGWIMEAFLKNKETHKKKDVESEDFFKSILHSLDKKKVKRQNEKYYS